MCQVAGYMVRVNFFYKNDIETLQKLLMWTYLSLFG